MLYKSRWCKVSVNLSDAAAGAAEAAEAAQVPAYKISGKNLVSFLFCQLSVTMLNYA